MALRCIGPASLLAVRPRDRTESGCHGPAQAARSSESICVCFASGAWLCLLRFLYETTIDWNQLCPIAILNKPVRECLMENGRGFYLHNFVFGCYIMFNNLIGGWLLSAF